MCKTNYTILTCKNIETNRSQFLKDKHYKKIPITTTRATTKNINSLPFCDIYDNEKFWNFMKRKCETKKKKS